MEKEKLGKRYGIEPLIIAIIGLILACLVVVWIGINIKEYLLP